MTYHHVLMSMPALFIIGLLAAILVYRKTGSVLYSSAVFTLIFSFGFAVDRIALPVPTLILTGMVAYEAVQKTISPPVCVQTSDGPFCDGSEGTAVIVFPLLLQWCFWFVVFFACTYRSARKRKQRDTANASDDGA
jgi:hypothetical protein